MFKGQLSIITLLLVIFTGSSLAQRNVCAGLYWGQIVANPYNCYSYYVCILTVPSERSCPPYEVFDASQKRCVAGNPDDCTIFGSTVTLPTTTEETTTTRPPPSLSEICRGVFFGARPYPDSYTTYVGCIREKGVLFQCFENEEFNPNINECLLYATVPPQ